MGGPFPMAKFNRGGVVISGSGPVVTERRPSISTYEGGSGYARDVKGELFQLAVSNMVGEDTFYESASDRDARFAQLVAVAAVDEPEWTVRLLRWLRTSTNLRSVALVGAAEFVRARAEIAKARHDARLPSIPAYNIPGATDTRGLERWVVDAVLQRPDEPGEIIAYWMSKYGRALPKPIKRGVADAVRRLYTERALLKYDTASHSFRFGDVVDLVHAAPDPGKPWQGWLFKYAIDRRHGRANPIPDVLRIIHANVALRAEVEATPHGADPTVLLDTRRLREAGMTWEDALSLAGTRSRPSAFRRDLWAALIPVMGTMALARNLRNFDNAGVPDEAIAPALAKFTDPAEVAASRMLPFQWFTAYREAPSLRWGHALDLALQASLVNVPALPGRSLVLLDTSASMTNPMSQKSTVTRLEAATVFAVALAARSEHVDLHGFADATFRHDVPRGASVIREVNRLRRRVGEVGHGTNIWQSVNNTFNGHDRVFILSDMQTMRDPHGYSGLIVPGRVPMYGFNLGGYRPAAFATGPNRVELGGLSDATFRLIPMIEAGRNCDWPF